YYSYQHPGDRPKTDEAVWTWYKFLIDEASNVENSAGTLSIGLSAPIGAFRELPMRRHLVNLSQAMALEVELHPTDKMRTKFMDKSIRPVWFAEIIHTIGYYVLLRWCGARQSDGVFWIHAANAALHSVGFTARNQNVGYKLVVPHEILGNYPSEQWTALAKQWVVNRLTPSDLYEERGNEMCFNKFKVGERVETIHDDETSVLVPATV
ncbi:hypothetical protein PMAYCL1PPCAC_30270, partial [Pristionchus mayeri]